MFSVGLINSGDVISGRECDILPSINKECRQCGGKTALYGHCLRL